MLVGEARRQGSRTILRHVLRVGFVPLIDAAPLIVAAERGFFSDEGLDVRLEQQIGWGNIRDRLTYGQLHASHAPLGMAPASLAGMDYYDEPLAVLMCLGGGGNAVTFSRRLESFGDEDSAVRNWRRHLGRPLTLAYVFATASHHFFLRELLHRAGLQSGRDATLWVMPPRQMPGLLESGTIDGYCVGEPWNTMAVTRGCGTIVRATTELAADHPEKVLTVTRRWYDQNPLAAERLVRAVVRGCDFCEDSANQSALIEMLARPEYLGVDEDVIFKSLTIDTWLRPAIGRPRFRTFARASTVPRVQSVVWVIQQLLRWGILPQINDIDDLARTSVISQAYENAVSTLPPTVKRQGRREIKGQLV